FTRTGSTANALLINFTVGGTATSGSDYPSLGTSVTIPAGSSTATKSFTPVKDGIAESSETVILTLASGSYTIGSPASGTATIVDGATSTQAVTSFTLVNASTGQAIPGFSSIPNGATIDLSQTGSNISIRDNTSPSTVGSVLFGLDGNANFHVENGAPYALLGNNGSVYTPWNANTGSHTLTGTPFTGSGLTGTVGTVLTISFTITNGINTNWSSITPSPIAQSEGQVAVVNGKLYTLGAFF